MPERRRTTIRAWRQHRGLTLRELANRINSSREEPLISYASLCRIECGQQPYSQDILEAIAEALRADPALLLAGDPNGTEQLATLWGRLSGHQRRLVIAIMQAILLCG